MKKTSYTIFLFLLAGLLPLQASWPLGRKSFKNATRRPKSVAQISNLASRKVERIAARQAQRNAKTKEDLLQKSTVTIELPIDKFASWEKPKASAFIIEETYKGKKRLWGVSASHYRFTKPLWKEPRTQILHPITFVAQGSFGFNDVTLFPVPEEMQETVEPFVLADEPVLLGDQLHSVGYFDEGFHLEENRTVTEVSPHRIITSLQVKNKFSREGACGGPVLNKQGKVVGMHAGSSENRQAGFVIPAQHIREALYAYYHHGQSLHPLRLNGYELGQININEYIYSLETLKENQTLDLVFSYRSQSVIDYEHLEDFIDTSDADTLILTIHRSPFSTLEEDQSIHTIIITYDLHSHQINVQGD